jgi:hypothetical protein
VGVQDEAEALLQQARSCFPQSEVLIKQITPILDALGFTCISKE